jgi:hypothetical protein
MEGIIPSVTCLADTAVDAVAGNNVFNLQYVQGEDARLSALRLDFFKGAVGRTLVTEIVFVIIEASAI